MSEEMYYSCPDYNFWTVLKVGNVYKKYSASLMEGVDRRFNRGSVFFSEENDADEYVNIKNTKSPEN